MRTVLALLPERKGVGGHGRCVHSHAQEGSQKGVALTAQGAPMVPPPLMPTEANAYAMASAAGGSLP